MWWAKLKFWNQRQPVQVKIIEREPFKIILREWQADPHLCAAAESALKSPLFISMLQTLRNTHLSLNVLPAGTDMQERAFHQARCEGYSLALNDLESMGRLNEAPKKLPEPGFEAEEIPDDMLAAYRVPIRRK